MHLEIRIFLEAILEPAFKHMFVELLLPFYLEATLVIRVSQG